MHFALRGLFNKMIRKQRIINEWGVSCLRTTAPERFSNSKWKNISYCQSTWQAYFLNNSGTCQQLIGAPLLLSFGWRIFFFPGLTFHRQIRLIVLILIYILYSRALCICIETSASLSIQVDPFVAAVNLNLNKRQTRPSLTLWRQFSQHYSVISYLV